MDALTLNFFTKENNKTTINSKSIIFSDIQSVSKVMPKTFEVDEETYSYLEFNKANCFMENNKFFIKSYIVKITYNSNEEKNYFAVSQNQVQLIRNKFKDIYSEKLLSQASNLIDMFQPTKIKINFK